MKNKLLVCACAMALCASLLTSCREKVDVYAICDDVSAQTLDGFFSSAVCEEGSMTLNVLQYTFAKDGRVTREEMALGHGLGSVAAPRQFSSWSFGEYNNGNKGRFLLLKAADGGEDMEVNFIYGGILEDGHALAADKNNKMSNVVSSQEAICGKIWYGNDTSFYKIDTIVDIMKYDTTYTYTPKKDPDTGKPMRDSTGHIIYDRTVKSIDSTLVPTKKKWPIGPKSIMIRQLELQRDPISLENTGSWYMKLEEYSMDENRQFTLEKDTLSQYDFNWCFESFPSSGAYTIKARQANGVEEIHDIKYDAKIPAITMEKQVMRIKQ